MWGVLVTLCTNVLQYLFGKIKYIRFWQLDISICQHNYATIEENLLTCLRGALMYSRGEFDIWSGVPFREIEHQ